MKNTGLRIITLGLSLFTSAAFALNFGFMNEGPAGYFTNKDFKIMEGTATRTLNTAKDGRKVSWKNPNTTAWGYFIPSNTRTEQGITCRTLRIFQSAKSVTNLASYNFCRIQGDWRIAN